MLQSMEQPVSLSSLQQLLSSTDLTYAYNPVHIVIILTSLIVITVLTTLLRATILKPENYRLDLSQKEFCKTLAEIDNELRFNRGDYSRRTVSNLAQQQSATDCVTDRINGSEYPRPLYESGNDDNSSGAHTGSANHVYPSGWIPLIESSKVKPASVVRAIIFGKDVIVTRSAEGNQVNVLDAYCPHMGVHIGISGRVRQIENQSCVECPFHGWTFRASDGQCVDIPYQKSSSIPKQAKLGSWTCVEIDNFIYVWHHADNQPPSWSMVPFEELISGKWQLAGRSCHKTNLELRDMHENGADMNHFEGIHNDLFIFGGQLKKLRPLNYLQKYTRHHWLPQWRPILDEAGKMTHMAEMNLQSWISLLTFRLFDITVHAKQIGPARVNLYYNSKWYGEGLLIMNAIPLGGRRTKYIQHIYTHRTLFQFFMAKWVLYGEIRMLERDFFIWNHKKNIKNPIFIPEDKTLKQFRMWYKQFYPKKKVTVGSKVENGISKIDPRVSAVTCNSFDF